MSTLFLVNTNIGPIPINKLDTTTEILGKTGKFLPVKSMGVVPYQGEYLISLKCWETQQTMGVPTQTVLACKPELNNLNNSNLSSLTLQEVKLEDLTNEYYVALVQNREDMIISKKILETVIQAILKNNVEYVEKANLFEWSNINILIILQNVARTMQQQNLKLDPKISKILYTIFRQAGEPILLRNGNLMAVSAEKELEGFFLKVGNKGAERTCVKVESVAKVPLSKESKENKEILVYSIEVEDLWYGVEGLLMKN